MANDESMAIKVTDEGGTVVIMDSNFYKYNIMKILSNTDYYYKKNQPMMIKRSKKNLLKILNQNHAKLRKRKTT